MLKYFSPMSTRGKNFVYEFCVLIKRKPQLKTQDKLRETLDKTKESCNEEVTKLEEKADEVKAQMSDLKTHLYAKFGNAINLENDE